jgi:levansucrase
MTAWTRDHLATLTAETVGQLPLIEEPDLVPVVDGIDIWDSWPIRTADGSIADVCGRVVWVALAVPSVGDPVLRHDIARQRAFLAECDGSFDDLGPLFPDGDALGARQWAGSTMLDGDRVHAYYTAVGIAGADPPGFRQRLVVATATLSCDDGRPRFHGWSDHIELFPPDPRWYDTVDQIDGEPGFIKAFRDPFPFVDQASGIEYVFLTASLSPARSTSDFNGAIGVARRVGDGLGDWELLEPLITADTVNNELERPHVVVVDGRYYLFFSTQRRTFHPDIDAPTGLCGFVADEVLGPYLPINGHGLVFMNPPQRPVQAYSWLVLNDLSVVGFIDGYGIDADGKVLSTPDRDDRPLRFGGTFSPTVHIAIDGHHAQLTAAT